MRIVGGALKGAKLMGPQSDKTRPTLDQTRESIFNILTSLFLKQDCSFEGRVVLDAFAGTGALGLEALSRGARNVYFFEKDHKALRTIEHNIQHLKVEKDCRIIRGDVLNAPVAPEKADLAFFDPPYHRDLLIPAFHILYDKGWIMPGCCIVLEMRVDEIIVLKNTQVLVEKNYRETKICILQAK